MSKWHCSTDGAKYGPVSAQELRNWLADGRLKPTDHVWTEGVDDWVPYNTVGELNPGIAPQAGGVYVQGPGQVGPREGTKSQLHNIIDTIDPLWRVASRFAVPIMTFSVPM